MRSKNLPSISILIPTLNAAKVLDYCLESIAAQDYPKEKIEIIIADGGSTDNTLGVITNFKLQSSKFKVKVLPNPLKTGEAGKAITLKEAKNELVALIDSDNILPDKNWLRHMIEPFANKEIIGSEPWEFTYRKQDGFIDRYCALMGMNDPLCLFLGNYDKKSVLTGRWTDLPVEQEDKDGWIKVTLKPGALPTIGANGTILREEILKKHLRRVYSATSEVARQRPRLLRGECLVDDYLFDIDIITQLASQKLVKFAKVKTGIVHL
jgi:glycosyltransferase involved in cell wall biosynthesis